jgi:hypothetical protein
LLQLSSEKSASMPSSDFGSVRLCGLTRGIGRIVHVDPNGQPES